MGLSGRAQLDGFSSAAEAANPVVLRYGTAESRALPGLSGNMQEMAPRLS